MNELLVEKLLSLNVTNCPYFMYCDNDNYFGLCNYTQGYCDLQPKCEWKNGKGEEQLNNFYENFNT